MNEFKENNPKEQQNKNIQKMRIAIAQRMEVTGEKEK